MSTRKSLSRTAKVKFKAKLDEYDRVSEDEVIDAPPPPQDFIEAALLDADDSQAYSSDGSEYGNNRASKRRRLPNLSRTAPRAKRPKRLTISKKARASDPPPPPELSDEDDHIEQIEDREDVFSLFSDSRRKIKPAQVKARLMSKTLRIEVKNAPAVIHINLGDLLAKQSPTQSLDTSNAADLDLDGDTLLDGDERQPKSRKHGTQGKEGLDDYFHDMRLNKKYASFLELEPHLRNRIYREMLISGDAIQFGGYHGASGLPNQAPLLRTCRQVCEEASDILYGENAFHFNRKSKERGRYWDKQWSEVGYKDVRRFLEHIGPQNIAKMRYLSILFDDATPSNTPRLEAPERKFVNDPVVLHLLRLIANSGAVLEKFVVGFGGRSQVTLEDVHFLRALTAIKCQDLVSTCAWGHSKIHPWLMGRIKTFMVVPEDDTIDRQRRKIPPMYYEAHGRSHCWDRLCRWKNQSDDE